MTTDSNEVNSPRPIEDLMKLGTYQGMTDEEIQLVMNYTAAIAAKEAVFAEQMDIQRQQMEAKAQAYRDSATHADMRLDQLIAQELNLETVKVTVMPDES